MPAGTGKEMAKKVSFVVEEDEDDGDTRPRHSITKTPSILDRSTHGRFRKLCRAIGKMASVCRSLANYAHVANIDYTDLQIALGRAKSKDLKFSVRHYKKPAEFCWPAASLPHVIVQADFRKPSDIDVVLRNMRTLHSFRELPDNVQRNVCSVIKYQKYGRQRILAKVDHPVENIYFIFSGVIRQTFLCSTNDDIVNPELETRTFKKGDLFGEGDLHKGIRMANYTCEEPCEVLLLHVDDVITTGLVDVFKSRRRSTVALLREIDLFYTWPDSAMEEMTSSGHVTTYMTNRLIDQTSYRPQFVWFILTGAVDLLREISPADIPIPLASNLNSALISSSRNTVQTSNREVADKSIQFIDDISRNVSYISREGSKIRPTTSPDINIQSATESDVTSSSKATSSSSQMTSSSSSTLKSSSYASEVATEKPVQFVYKCIEKTRKSPVNKLPAALHFKVKHFTKGSFFTFAHAPRSRGRLHLVSQGSTILGVPLTLFRRYQTSALVSHVHEMLNRLPTVDFLVNDYIKSLRWKKFREDFVQSSCIHHRASDRDNQHKHRRACYYWRPVTVPPRELTPANHRPDTGQSLVAFINEEERFTDASEISIRRLASGGYIMPTHSHHSGVMPRLLKSAPVRRRPNVKT